MLMIPKKTEIFYSDEDSLFAIITQQWRTAVAAAAVGGKKVH
jgi:hypothetical protein